MQTCPHCGKELTAKTKKTDMDAVMNHFIDSVKMLHGFEPEIGRVDAVKVSQILKKYDVQTATAMIDFFLESRKANECGITLAMAFSIHSINTYKQSLGDGGSRVQQLLRSRVRVTGGAGRVCSGGSVVAGVLLPKEATARRGWNVDGALKQIPTSKDFQTVRIYGEDDE